MAELRRLVLVRHGETEGNSSERLHGSSDVPLSEEGRAQVREAGRRLRQEVFDLVVASPLRRAWEAAWLLLGGAPIRIEDDFREIHFGRWEGLTAEEVKAADPALYEQWRSRAADFEFPGGEPRADFRERVLRGLERLERSGAAGALVVAHKGVVRTIAEKLLERPLEESELGLGAIVSLSRGPDGAWYAGRRSSDPEPLRQQTAA